MPDVPSDAPSITDAISDHLVQRAYRLATSAHEGQFDKAGEPYIAHPIAVAERVRHLGALYQVVAVLHDTVEDTDVDLDDIEALFGPTASEAVDAITRREGEAYLDFIRRAAQNDVAAIVKRADIEHNLSRSDSLTASLESRYHKALALLDQIQAEAEGGVRMGPPIDIEPDDPDGAARVRAYLEQKAQGA